MSMKVRHFTRSVKANGLLLAMLLATWLFLPHQQLAVAQGPDGEPLFEAAIYASANGDSTIVSQRAVLTGATFGSTGVADSVVITPGGLSLATGAITGAYRSNAIRSPLEHTTDIVLTWLADIPQGASVSVEARLSSDGQTWGNWLPVPVEHYPTRDGEYSGALIWVDNTPVYFQFKLTLQASEGDVSPVFRRLTLFFNNTSQGPSDKVAALQARGETVGPTSTICPAKPAVISRTAWGCPDGQSSPRWPPTYQTVTHIVINHTATPNSASDWARVVRSIWNYHANTWGWGDTGYHYLIDPLGNIYEGRAGGDDVIGAYDGFNRGSMGIGYVGCYGNCGYLGLSNADPSSAMLDAGNNLMAWKAGPDQKEIAPHGTGYYCEATLPNIVARSDVTCRGGSLSPGDRLRAQIPSMRDAIQEKIDACFDLLPISGTVLLQGRTDHSGTDVSLTAAPCPATDDTGALTTVTDVQGHFNVTPTANYQCLKAVHACYLTGQKSSPRGNVGTITLPGGDVNGDNCVTILDLTLIGARNGLISPSPACADVNADGVVDIYDLVIAARNFGSCGPVTNWE
jgi:hypothetical protein